MTATALAMVRLSADQSIAETYWDECFDVVAVPLSGGRALAVWQGSVAAQSSASPNTDDHGFLGARVISPGNSLGPPTIVWTSPHQGTFSSPDGTVYLSQFEDSNYGLAASVDGADHVLVVYPIWRWTTPTGSPSAEWNLIVLLDCSGSTPTVLDTVYDTYRANDPCTVMWSGHTNEFFVLHDDGVVVANTSSGLISLGAVQQHPDAAAGQYGEFMVGFCTGAVGVIKFNTNHAALGTYDYGTLYPFTYSGGVITWGTPISGGDLDGTGTGNYWAYYYPGGTEIAHDGTTFAMVGGLKADSVPTRAMKLSTDGSTITFVAASSVLDKNGYVNAGWANSQTRYDQVVATGGGMFTVLWSTNASPFLTAWADAFGTPSRTDYLSVPNTGYNPADDAEWSSISAINLGGAILAVGEFGFMATQGTSAHDQQVWYGILAPTPNLAGASGPAAAYFWRTRAN